MRLFPFLSFVLLAVAAGGCAAPSPCERVPATLTLERVTGTDLLVGNGSLVLHAATSAIHVRDGSGCHEASVADLRVGDRIGHDADQVGESYPAQAWPTTVVAHR